MAKRVNTRFLILLTVIVLGGGVLLMAARFVATRLIRQDPQELVRESQQLEAAGEIDQAVARYGQAVSRAPRDVDLRIALGDLYYRTVAHDRQNFAKARDAWAGVLAIDPKHRPALERLLDSSWDVLAQSSRAEAFNQVRADAARLAAAHPDHLRARARLHVATLWGAQAEVPTRREDIVAALGELRKLAGADPADAEIAVWVGRGELQLATLALKGAAGVDEGREILGRLEQWVPKMLEGQAANGPMQLAAAQLYRAMGALDLTVNPPKAGAEDPRVKRRGGRFAAQGDAALAAARANVKPGDAQWVELQLFAADWLAANGQEREATAVLDEMVAARGDDPKVRLGYARMLGRDPARRGKLIELLSRPVDLKGVGGAEYLLRSDVRVGLQLELAAARLSAVEAEGDPAKRAAALEQVRADVRKLEADVNPQGAAYLELTGRLALADGNLPEGIMLLQQSVDRRGAEGAPSYEVMLQLARAYLAAGQTGQAEKLLRRVAQRYPSDVPTRALLIRTLVSDGDPDAARRELASLRQQAPQAPELAGLAALVEGGAARDAFVGQLPEGTADEKVNKAAALRGEGKSEAAIELARAAFEQDRTNLRAVDQMLEMYLAAGRHDDALALADEAIAANPDSAALKRLPEQLAAAKTPEAADAWTLGQINAEPDPVARAMRLADFHARKADAAARGGDAAARQAAVAEAERQLAVAGRLKPGDAGVAARRFELMLSAGRLDEAAAMLPALAAANTDKVNGELLRFRLAMARPDLAAAEAAAREITRRLPQFAAGYESLGAALQAQGRHREAQAAYTAALDRQGRNYVALRGLIETHTALDQQAEAKAAMDRARALFPRDPAVRDLALNYEAAHGNLDAVIAERERLFEEQPGAAGRAVALADAHYRAAVRPGADPARARDALARSRQLLETAAAKSPADGGIAGPLATVLLAQDDFPGGERVLKEFAARADVKDKVAADLMLAEYYARAGKPASAEQSLRDALAKTGGGEGAPAVRQQLATQLAAAGKHEEAVGQLEGLAGVGPARQRVQYLLALGRAADAERAARDAAAAAGPASAEASDLLLETLLNAGPDAARLAEAEKLIGERLARDEADDTARYFGALVKLRRRPADVQGATRDLGDLVNRNPRSAPSRALLAEAHRAGGNVAAAIEELGRALDLTPLNRGFRARLIEWCVAAGRWDAVLKVADAAIAEPRLANDPAWFRAAAAAYAATGKVDQAEQAMVRALALFPPERNAEVQNEYLAILLNAKQYPKVLTLTDQWIGEGRKTWWLYRARGLARHERGDAAGALTEFDAALATLDPAKQFGEARAVVQAIGETAGWNEAMKRADQRAATGDPRWALVAAEFGLSANDSAVVTQRLEPMVAAPDKLEPDVRAAAYRLLALAYHRIQPNPPLEKALAMYQKYLELRPDDVLVLNNVAYMLAEELANKDLAQAKTYSKRAYDLMRDAKPGEDKSRVLDTHGWVLVLSGGSDLNEGMRLLEEIVAEAPIIDAHYHLGEANLRKKRGDEAERQLTLALNAIAKAKAEKQPFDPSLEPRVKDALEKAKALNAAAGAG